MSPRTAAQNQALRDATRVRLLDAALRVFARHGYAAASVRLIASEAGVAPGLLYSHFEGKRDLLRAIFARSMEDVGESFAAAEPPGGAADAAPLAMLIRAACAIVRRNLDFWRLTYGVRMQPEVLRDLGPELEAWTGRILGTLEAHFRGAGSPRPQPEAAALFAAIDGMCQHYAMDPDRYPLEAVAESLIAKYAPPAKGGRRKAGNHGPSLPLRRARKRPGRP